MTYENHYDERTDERWSPRVRDLKQQLHPAAREKASGGEFKTMDKKQFTDAKD